MIDRISKLADSFQTIDDDRIIAINARHSDALARAKDCLRHAIGKIENNGPIELLASDLRGTLDGYGEIVGKIDNERMLDQLFATFCIGK